MELIPDRCFGLTCKFTNFSKLKQVYISPSTTLPSESVLHALMTSFPAEYSSKQCGLFLSVETSRTRIFSSGIIPRGSCMKNIFHNYTSVFKRITLSYYT